MTHGEKDAELKEQEETRMREHEHVREIGAQHNEQIEASASTSLLP